ncbi:MAG TPA: hypothetical protein VK085_02185 [Pseudogracilibacillus sp.]|nr:hypothetical protein [Pseudogracilibacillus sp.]
MSDKRRKSILKKWEFRVIIVLVIGVIGTNLDDESAVNETENNNKPTIVKIKLFNKLAELSLL